MFLKKFIFTLSCLVVMLVGITSYAKEVDEYAGLDPETIKIVKECRDPEWDSGKGFGDYQMAQMNMKDTNCMKKKLAEYLETLYTEDEKDTKTEALKQLDNMEKSLLLFYRDVFNYNKYCRLGEHTYDCGTYKKYLAEDLWLQELTRITDVVITETKGLRGSITY